MKYIGKTKSKSKTANPESMRLNPKSMSYFAPQKSISGNCVNKIAVPLMIFITGFKWPDLIVHQHVKVTRFN